MDAVKTVAEPQVVETRQVRAVFALSVADIIFVVILAVLLFAAPARLLLDQASQSYIDNGRRILAGWGGAPWISTGYAYDAAVAVTYRVSGGGGVALLTAFVIALTFGLVYRFAAAESTNGAVSVVVTALSFGAGARYFRISPEAATWLLVLLWLRALVSYQEGRARQLYWMPALMLLWVNLDGGYLFGLALLGVFLVANLWTRVTSFCPKRGGRAAGRTRHLAPVLALSLGASFVAPQGNGLYAWILNHLSMQNATRFLPDTTPTSFDFHSLSVVLFAWLLSLGVVGLVLQTKLRVIDVLLVGFAGWTGLFAPRHIATAAIILALVAAPLLAKSFRSISERNDIRLRFRGLAGSLDRWGQRVAEMERSRTSHIWPIMAVIAIVVIRRTLA